MESSQAHPACPNATLPDCDERSGSNRPITSEGTGVKVDSDYVPEDIHESDEDEEECVNIQLTKIKERTKSPAKTGLKLDKDLKNKTVTCTECKKKVSSGYLRKHYMKRHKELCEVYKCTFCSWESLEKFEYFNHMRTHTGGKPHVCSECHDSFSRLEHLRDHVMKMHTNTKHDCVDCGKQFTSIAALRKHRYVVHENKPRKKTKRRPKICSYCGHVFYMLCDLKAHEMAHRGEKPFKCSQCDLRFTTQSHRKKHEVVHTNTKPHMCSFCGFSSNRKANLRNHERIHTGDLPYPCDLCELKFRVKTQLKKHKLKVHSVDISQEESKKFGGTDLRRKGKAEGVKSVRRQTVRNHIASKEPAQSGNVAPSAPVLAQAPQDAVSVSFQGAAAVPANVHTNTVIASKVLSFSDSNNPQSAVDIPQSLAPELGQAGSANMVPASTIVTIEESNSYCVQAADGIANLQQTSNLESSTENWMNLFN